VVSKPFAFSVFGKTDPNRTKMARVDESDPVFISAVLAAISAVSGADPTSGATHFVSGGLKPGWAARMTVTARIGGHVYFRSQE
jgi:spore germination cell wall hydrolase CwlJ-like protein